MGSSPAWRFLYAGKEQICQINVIRRSLPVMGILILRFSVNRSRTHIPATVSMYDSQEKELVLADKMEERQQQRAEAQKDAKEAEQVDKPGKAERGEKKPERERVSMKEKLPEKKAEVAKNEASREHPLPAKSKETMLA